MFVLLLGGGGSEKCSLGVDSDPPGGWIGLEPVVFNTCDFTYLQMILKCKREPTSHVINHLFLFLLQLFVFLSVCITDCCLLLIVTSHTKYPTAICVTPTAHFSLAGTGSLVQRVPDSQPLVSPTTGAYLPLLPGWEGHCRRCLKDRCQEWSISHSMVLAAIWVHIQPRCGTVARFSCTI